MLARRNPPDNLLSCPALTPHMGVKSGQGRNSPQRTLSQTIRTEAEISMEIPLLDSNSPFEYQRIAEKAIHLRELGMTYKQSAKR
jgi:hypothetical protein